MSDGQPVDPRRAYILAFRRALQYWRTTNLADSVCITQAIKTATSEHPLDETQQRDVDGFLKDELKPKPAPWQHTGASESLWIDFEAE